MKAAAGALFALVSIGVSTQKLDSIAGRDADPAHVVGERNLFVIHEWRNGDDACYESSHNDRAISPSREKKRERGYGIEGSRDLQADQQSCGDAEYHARNDRAPHRDNREQCRSRAQELK